MSALPLPATAGDNDFASLVEAARTEQPSHAEVARLARHLADSGERMEWTGDDVADVASTGGPGSLSTLLAPLALRARGCRIVKLAVPGRPAGAIDSLGTIPGYRVRSSTTEVQAAVADCGFAHFLADERFAPLDAALFQYRRRTNAVAVPVLAAASLLAKKLAVGVRLVGLDVRVGAHGNFGVTDADARASAILFCEAARVLGISATAFLSADKPPAQPWIGRGESLAALTLALGIHDVEDQAEWLQSHVERCYRMADEAVGHTGGEVSRASLRDALEGHLRAHGTNIETLSARAHSVISAPRDMVEAWEAGVFTVSLGDVRSALVALQVDGNGVFSDLAGLQFLHKSGDVVTRGEPLVRVRCEGGGEMMQALLERVRSAIRLVSQSTAVPSAPADMEVVRA